MILSLCINNISNFVHDGNNINYYYNTNDIIIILI